MYEIVHQPGDGSCFYHSFLYSISQEFRQMSYTEKKQTIQKIRNYFADVFEASILPDYMMNNLIENYKQEFYERVYNDLFKNKSEESIRQMFREIGVDIGSDFSEFTRKTLTVDMLAEIAYHQKVDWKEYAIRKQKKTIQSFCTFVDNISILMTLCYYKKNIILLRHNSQEVYYSKILNNDYKFVVLDYEIDTHYELYSRQMAGGLIFQTTFNKRDPFISNLLGPYV